MKRAKEKSYFDESKLKFNRDRQNIYGFIRSPFLDSKQWHILTVFFTERNKNTMKNSERIRIAWNESEKRIPFRFTHWTLLSFLKRCLSDRKKKVLSFPCSTCFWNFSHCRSFKCSFPLSLFFGVRCCRTFSILFYFGNDFVRLLKSTLSMRCRTMENERVWRVSSMTFAEETKKV